MLYLLITTAALLFWFYFPAVITLTNQDVVGDGGGFMFSISYRSLPVWYRTMNASTLSWLFMVNHTKVAVKSTKDEEKLKELATLSSVEEQTAFLAKHGEPLTIHAAVFTILGLDFSFSWITEEKE